VFDFGVGSVGTCESAREDEDAADATREGREGAVRWMELATPMDC
jgi:hypothetical protein